jgi:hypothetical protein
VAQQLPEVGPDLGFFIGLRVDKGFLIGAIEVHCRRKQLVYAMQLPFGKLIRHGVKPPTSVG